MSIFDYLEFTEDGYRVISPIHYDSPRYKKTVTVPVGFWSDGATMFPDVDSYFWVTHDYLVNGKGHDWDDGSHCSNWQASVIVWDILSAEKKHLIKAPVFLAVWGFGMIRQLFKWWLK